jgi:hypothetical protein
MDWEIWGNPPGNGEIVHITLNTNSDDIHNHDYTYDWFKARS